MRVEHIPSVFWKKWDVIDQDYSSIKFENIRWCAWSIGKNNPGMGLHCYVDDWRIESIWRQPEKSLKYAMKAAVLIGPDFSVFQGNNDVVMWQIIRSNLITGFWQENGCYVVPSMTWASSEQIKAHKKMYVKRKIIAVRCPGKNYLNTWIEGANLIKKFVKPKLVLHFGTRRGIDVWDKALNIRLRSKKIDV